MAALVVVPRQAASLTRNLPGVGQAAGGQGRLSEPDQDQRALLVYLRRLSASGSRVRVEVVGASRLDGRIGWVDADDIESAGEKCPTVYSLN